MNHARLSRRLLLTALTVSPLGGLVACARRVPAARELPNPLVEPLMALLRNRTWARELGHAYMWRRSPRPDLHELVDHVLPQDGQRSLAAAPRWRLRQVVRERVEADYSRGRPTSVAGWMLSETEACLCALTVADDE